MQPKTYLQTVLPIIALWLGVIALRPAVHPITALAEPQNQYLYVEPGTTLLDGQGSLLRSPRL